jgi:hypothetical protein
MGPEVLIKSKELPDTVEEDGSLTMPSDLGYSMRLSICFNLS